MIKSLNNTKIFSLKEKFINIIMVSGKKTSAEIILLNFAKKLQKSINKHSKKVTQLAIINSTSIFKLNEQIVKKGRRKTIKNNSSFIITDISRVLISFKSIKYVVMKKKESNPFYIRLTDEILLASNIRGGSVDKKIEMQKRILLNKRYLSKFYW